MSKNDILLIGIRPFTTKQSQENRKEKKTMEIIKIDAKAAESKILKYKLTSSPETQKMSNIDDGRLDVTHYCIYDDIKEKNGELVTTRILSVMTPDKELFATNSSTFMREFERILELFGEDLDTEGGYIPLHVFKGMSKNNRTFLTCAYAD